MARIKNNTFRYFYCAAIIIFSSAFIGCSTISLQKKSTPLRTARSPLTDNDRLKIATLAQKALGKSSLRAHGKSFRADCSGLVRAIFYEAKIGLGGILKSNGENDVKAIYRYTQTYGKILRSNPLPGDLVFFHNTYDRSRNGRLNDALTHIGIVEKVTGTTVHFIHHLGQSIIRSRLDLAFPKDTIHPQTEQRINHILRRAQGNYRAYTAAELFAGFGRL